jgi:diguanylate cyclase (GGDEF)-like protein
VLQEVGHIFEAAIRKHLDVAGRYGGEEFLLIYEDSEKDQVLNIIERLRQTIEDHEFKKIGPNGSPVDGECLHVTMSFGIALLDDKSTENSKQILSIADTALYRSKEGGRNQVTLGES